MIELTAHEGDGDAARTGYWTITGPQDEHEVFGTIERSILTSDERSRIVHAWYINRRTLNAYRTSVMAEVARGVADTFDGALAEVRVAWEQEIGSAVEDTAQIIYPWQTN